MGNGKAGAVPDWFRAIIWSTPRRVETVREDQTLIPDAPGVYAFLNVFGPVNADIGRVLYVGKAERQTLRKRLAGYLTVWTSHIGNRAGTGHNTALNHAGKALIWVKIAQRTRFSPDGFSGVWLCWTLTSDPAPLEKRLIQYLDPEANTSLRKRRE